MSMKNIKSSQNKIQMRTILGNFNQTRFKALRHIKKLRHTNGTKTGYDQSNFKLNKTATIIYI